MALGVPRGAVVLLLLLVTGVYALRSVAMETDKAAAPLSPLPVFSRSHNDSLYTGTYRPNVYFGTRTRDTPTVFTGFMWFDATRSLVRETPIRHDCEESDHLSRYGWNRHDGRSYGSQEIVDRDVGVILTTEFVKRPGKERTDWAVRIRGQDLGTMRKAVTVSLLYYIAVEEDAEHSLLRIDSRDKHLSSGISGRVVHLQGTSSTMGPFSVSFVESPDNQSPTVPSTVPSPKKKRAGHLPPNYASFHFAGFRLPVTNLWEVKNTIGGVLRVHELRARQERFEHEERERKQEKKKVKVHRRGAEDVTRSSTSSPPIFYPTLPDAAEDANVMVVQKLLQVPFELDIVFLAHTHGASMATERSVALEELTGASLTELLRSKEEAFGHRFEDTFQLHAKGFTDSQIALAKYALSNMIGGMGFFHGTSLAQFPNDTETRILPSASLFSGVPSRSFFPRGFLWDDGFHHLLLSEWDEDISKDSLLYWFNLMDEAGWIAREQILGEEARARVPEKYRVQFPHLANPPTLFMAIERLVERERGIRARRGSSAPSSSRTASVQAVASSVWGGEEEEGLVSAEDTRTFVAGIFPRMQRIYEWFHRTQPGVLPNSFRWRGREPHHTLPSGLDDYPRAPIPSEEERHLDLHCWMIWMADMMTRVADFLGKDSTVYATRREALIASLDEMHWSSEHNAYLDYAGTPPPPPTETEEDTPPPSSSPWSEHIGYVSLFPVILGILPPKDHRLRRILLSMQDSAQLFSPAGIRSLSRLDSSFGTREDYWRGAIWVNINYLILSSLHRHYVTSGPYAEQARRLFVDLRDTLVKNIYKEYKRTGYLWETYNGLTAHGQRSHPFTGWTGLVVLAMAEIF